MNRLKIIAIITTLLTPFLSHSGLEEDEAKAEGGRVPQAAARGQSMPALRLPPAVEQADAHPPRRSIGHWIPVDLSLPISRRASSLLDPDAIARIFGMMDVGSARFSIKITAALIPIAESNAMN